MGEDMMRARSNGGSTTLSVTGRCQHVPMMELAYGSYVGELTQHFAKQPGGAHAMRVQSCGQHCPAFLPSAAPNNFRAV